MKKELENFIIESDIQLVMSLLKTLLFLNMEKIYMINDAREYCAA